MGVSYAGVPLLIPDPELVARIESAIDLGDLLLQAAPDWTGIDPNWRIADYARDRIIHLGRLYWPTGASQWAIGRFLATEDQLDAIRQKCYVSGSAGVQAQDLVINDGDRKITTKMFVRPPRPLYQWTDDKSLYLVEFVDERFYWWWKSTSFGVPFDSTWQGVFGSIASTLGVTLALDAVDKKFLSPSVELSTDWDYLPLLLDTACYSIGRRLVKKLNGDFVVQKADDAITRRTTLTSRYAGNVISGGTYNFDRTGKHCDLASAVPNTIRMRFPTDSGDPEFIVYDQKLSDLSLPQYAGKFVTDGVKTVHSRAIAVMMGGSVVNDQQLKDLVSVWSTEWWKYQLADAAKVFQGTIPWDGDGLVDYVEWSAYTEDGSTPAASDMMTWTSREPINDMAIQVFQANEYDSEHVASGYITCYRDFKSVERISQIPNWQFGVVQLLGHDAEGCLKWFNIGDC